MRLGSNAVLDAYVLSIGSVAMSVVREVHGRLSRGATPSRPPIAPLSRLHGHDRVRIGELWKSVWNERTRIAHLSGTDAADRFWIAHLSGTGAAEQRAIGDLSAGDCGNRKRIAHLSAGVPELRKLRGHLSRGEGVRPNAIGQLCWRFRETGSNRSAAEAPTVRGPGATTTVGSTAS